MTTYCPPYASQTRMLFAPLGSQRAENGAHAGVLQRPVSGLQCVAHSWTSAHPSPDGLQASAASPSQRSAPGVHTWGLHWPAVHPVAQVAT